MPEDYRPLKKPVSVLFVTYGWRENGGGTLLPRKIAGELLKRGYHVSVLYASLEDDIFLPPCSIVSRVEEGICLYGMINRPAQFNDPDNPQREIDDPPVKTTYCQVLDAVQPDLVHFHNFHGLCFSIAEETYSRHIPSCLTTHNHYLIDPELQLIKNGLMRWTGVDMMKESEAVARNPHRRDMYLKRMDTARRLLNEWVNLTLAISYRQQELLLHFGGDQRRIAMVHQVSPMADKLWKDPAFESQRLRAIKLPLQVGYLGGIIPVKGVQMLVAAAQSFTPEELQVHLHGFSSALFQEDLRLLDHKGMVTFHGPYEHDHIGRLANGLDVAIISSLWEEAAPTLVLTELHAMRVPVIGARVGGIPEFITDGVDGFLYPPDDLRALVDILREFVDNPDQLEAMRRNLVAPTLTFAHYMEHLEKVYSALLSGNNLDASSLSLMATKRDIAAELERPYISWQGALFANHSLAHVNRELCLQLLEKDYRISFTPTEPDSFTPSDDTRFKRLTAIRNLPLETVDITIRHQWPPDFTPPDIGHFIMIQPWEFGSLPKSWIEPTNSVVDEVWVPSSYVKECYVASGVKPEQVQVVPNGVDTGQFNPDTKPYPLATDKTFRFLFVGGTIHRKGIDLLLGAYRTAFSVDDDVCLVIKDMGGSSFYQGQTAQELISRFRSDPQAPEIEYIDKDLSTPEIAGLYGACHCLVHPYRGEGFGLPIAEAMACGLAPIVTGYGAALDFCPSEVAWLLPSRVERLPIKQVGQHETVDYPWLAEPNFDALVTMLRHAAQNPEEVRRRGRAAADFIHENYTWEHAARIADERLQAVAKNFVRRFAVDSVQCSEQSLDLQSPMVLAACKQAERLALAGKVNQAIELLLNEGIRVDAADPRPYVTLAEILIREGRFQDALEVLPEMPAAVDPALKQELAAICHCGLGNDAAALQAAHLATGRPRALTVLGTLAARQGDPVEAERLFRQAIQTDPACGSGWLSLGMLLWGQGQQEEAWQAVKQAVTVDPLNQQAVQILRDMAERLG